MIGDLSKCPVQRANFSFGGGAEVRDGFFITDACIGCGVCVDVCPQRCIDISARPLKIVQEHCLHCGGCWRECPVDAVVKLG